MMRQRLIELGLERPARQVLYRLGLSKQKPHQPWPPHLKPASRAAGMVSPEEAVLLYELARSTREGCIVEIGSFRGRSSIVLGLGSTAGAGVPVYAVEPHEPFTGVSGLTFGAEDRRAFYRNMLRSRSYKNVRLLNVSSEVLAPGWKRPVGLLWIDGDHTYEGVRRDFESWQPHLTADAKVAFDDSIDPALGPAQLINELISAGTLRSIKTVGKISAFQVVRS